MTRTLRTIAAAGAVAAVATGCSSPWDGTAQDQAGYEACDGVFRALNDAGGADIVVALPPGERSKLIQAAQPGGRSEAEGMADAAAGVVRAGDAPRPLWAAALTEFSQTCEDLRTQPA